MKSTNYRPQIVAISNRRPTENYYTYNEFFASIRRHGYEPVILGANMGVYQGLSSKPKFLKKAILDGHITTKYIIFADCWDLVFAGSPEEIMEKFFEFNAPFVCSSEKNCFPGDLRDQFPDAGTSYRYLNSGFIVAEVSAMLSVLESMNLDSVPGDHFDPDKNCMVHPNDQFLYQVEFVKQPVKMVLDYKQELCQTMHDVKLEELDLSGERIKNIETGSTPLSIHLNGGSKTSGVREPILEKLGLWQTNL